jgi:hypothetical protein
MVMSEAGKATPVASSRTLPETTAGAAAHANDGAKKQRTTLQSVR